MTKRKIIVLISLFVSLLAKSQDFSVQAAIDSTIILIGEQTKIRFEIAQNKNAHIETPLFGDEIVEGIDVVRRLKPDTIALGNERIQVNIDYIVTSFDSALYYIPPFKFVSGKDTVLSNPLSLMVYTIPVDTEEEFLDIKPIYKAPFNWKEFLFWLGIGLLILVGLFLIYAFIQRVFFKKNVFISIKSKEIIPPHILAVRELDRIRNEKLWQQSRIYEYHTQLTDVLRLYIEQRFDINAIEMTTNEIMSFISLEKTIERTVSEKLREILELADLVKFAKFMPAISDNERSLKNAYTFVEQTKPIEVETDGNEKESNEERQIRIIKTMEKVKVRGVEGLELEYIENEINSNGARFIYFPYCISVIAFTFSLNSKIYFIRRNEKPIRKGWIYLIISVILGWWGIPWGPIRTISAIKNAFTGKDVTEYIMNS